MSLLDVFKFAADWLKEYGSLSLIIIIIAASLIQVTPLNLNPWSAFGKLLRAAGKYMNRDILESVNELKTDLKDLSNRTDGISKAVDENEIDRIRYEILTFASNLSRGENFTKAEFDRIFKLDEKYHMILKRAKLTNGQVDREMAYITHVDKEKHETDSYLK